MIYNLYLLYLIFISPDYALEFFQSWQRNVNSYSTKNNDFKSNPSYITGKKTTTVNGSKLFIDSLPKNTRAS